MESGKSSRLRLNQLRSGQTDQGGQELKVICVGFGA